MRVKEKQLKLGKKYWFVDWQTPYKMGIHSAWTTKREALNAADKYEGDSKFEITVSIEYRKFRGRYF